MINKIYGLAIAIVALSLVACDKSNHGRVDVPTEGSPVITLSAGVVSMDNTRAFDANVYTGTSAAGMEAAVWFSKVCGVYEDNPTPQAPTYLPYHSIVKYESGSPTTVYVDPENKNFPLTYPINDAVGNSAYCVGLYPATGWTTGDGKSAYHPIDGSVDIMFADQIVGSWDTPFATQSYKHLLSWLKLEVKVADVSAIDQWGAVTKLSVESSDGVTITFPTTLDAYSTIEYAATTTEIDALRVAQLPLTVTAQSVGSLLCAPSSTIKLKIKTEKSDEMTIDVALSDANGNSITSAEQTASKLFIINIYFNTLNNIEATCSLIPWNEQNVDL